MANTALITVQFHGDIIQAVDINGKPHISIRSICDALGINWSGQLQRMKRHDAIGPTVCVTHTVGADGKQREIVCLPLDMLNGWLFGITASRVKDPSKRVRLVDYQRECFAVLDRHFNGARDAGAPALPAPAHGETLQARMDRAQAMAADLAARVSREVFTAVMADDQAHWSDRWLFAWNKQAPGIPEPATWVGRLEDDCMVVRKSELASRICGVDGLHLSNAQLGEVAMAVSSELARRLSVSTRATTSRAIGRQIELPATE